MSTRSDDRRSTAKPAPAVEPYRWEVRPGCRTHAGRWSCSTRPYTPRGTVGVHTGWHRHEVLRPSYPVDFQPTFSSARAWSIWSYAWVTMAAVVIASPFRASDSYVGSPRTSRRYAIEVLISGNASAMRGLTAKPATVAPDSLASEPVEESGKHSQRPAHGRGVARGVEVVDCQSNPTRTQGPRDPHAVGGADPSTDGGHASRLAPPTDSTA
jgi:hypothetical protein